MVTKLKNSYSVLATAFESDESTPYPLATQVAHGLTDLLGAVHEGPPQPPSSVGEACLRGRPRRAWGSRENFLYEFKAGPADGRLRRPSSAGSDSTVTRNRPHPAATTEDVVPPTIAVRHLTPRTLRQPPPALLRRNVSYYPQQISLSTSTCWLRELPINYIKYLQEAAFDVTRRKPDFLNPV
jgi:hypothetical protein